MNKKCARLFFICLYCLIVAILLGCSKNNTESNLKGRWSRVFVENIDDSTLEEDWEFFSNGDLIISTIYPLAGDTIKSIAKFSMVSYNKFEVSLLADSYNFPSAYVGKWSIVKKGKNILQIVLEDKGLFFREFIKD